MLNKNLALACFLMTLAACGSSSTIRKAMPLTTTVPLSKFNIAEVTDKTGLVPPQFLLSIKVHLEKILQNQKLLADAADSIFNRINIEVTSYRMRSSGMRFAFGVFAGADSVTSEVRVTDSVSKDLIGEAKVDTANMLAVGSEEDIAQMHAEKIIAFLEGKDSQSDEVKPKKKLREYD